MKICIPVTSKDGLEAALEAEFTAAEHLLVIDMLSGEQRTFSRHAEEGDAADEEPISVDAVLCAGMHPQIIGAFAAQGIKIFATEAESVALALEAFKQGEVEELVAHGGGCCGGAHHHAQEEEHECCGGGGCGGEGHGHDHGDEHECCGGEGHADDHECCGGKGHGKSEGQGGCGCHG